METNLSGRFKGRFLSSLGQAKVARPNGKGQDPSKLEKSLSPAQMTESIREGSHPPRFDDKIAEKFLGGEVGGRSVVVRGLGPLAFRVSGVNLNRMMKGEDGWKLERVFAGRPFDHREEAPTYAEVETALGVKEEVLVEGSVVLRSAGGEPVIVRTRETMSGYEIAVLAKKGGAGSTLLKSLDWLNATKNFYKGQKITALGDFLKLSTITEEDLIFPPGLREDLNRNVMSRIERAAQYKEYGLPTKRGLILAGAPGIGKTMYLKLMAKSLPTTFIQAVPTMLPRASHIASLYDFARSVAPTVIALEDAETICKHDWMGRDPRLVELLNQLDGVVENSGVTTILTTNYPGQLDRAIKDRPGRFDVRLDIPLPGKSEIARIIRRNIERMGKAKYTGSQASMDDISQRLANAGVSGAYAAESVTYASILAIEHGKSEGGELSVGAEELGEAARRIIEYKKQMAEEK